MPAMLRSVAGAMADPCLLIRAERIPKSIFTSQITTPAVRGNTHAAQHNLFRRSGRRGRDSRQVRVCWGLAGRFSVSYTISRCEIHPEDAPAQEERQGRVYKYAPWSFRPSKSQVRPQLISAASYHGETVRRHLRPEVFSCGADMAKGPAPTSSNYMQVAQNGRVPKRRRNSLQFADGKVAFLFASIKLYIRHQVGHRQLQSVDCAFVSASGARPLPSNCFDAYLIATQALASPTDWLPFKCRRWTVREARFERRSGSRG